jgi:hypothetical protein
MKFPKKAKRIKNIKHMIEIIKWAKGFAEYKKVFDKNWCLLIGRWLYFNFNKSHNDYIVFKP